ncbi:hypothetical protein Gotur_021351 [Gossypium turneri]
MILSELEIVKQDFEKRSSELGKKHRKVRRGKDSARIRHQHQEVAMGKEIPKCSSPRICSKKGFVRKPK